ncbi:MAG: hypothetical protein WCK86_11680 [Planctomycetia bacterium]
MKRFLIAVVLVGSLALTCTASKADDHHHRGRRNSNVGFSFSIGSGGDRFSGSYGRGSVGRHSYGGYGSPYGSPYGYGGFGPVYSQFPVYSVPVYSQGFYSVPVYGGGYSRRHGHHHCD